METKVVFPPDPCLSIFADVAKDVGLGIKRGARILEIGCAEANWLSPMKQARPDLHLIGIDVRPCRRPGAAVIEGDVLTFDFEPEFFDMVVLISTLEHIGLGYYGDPRSDDADFRCLNDVHGWLKHGGVVYFDVPYYKNHHITKKRDCAVYDDAWLNGVRPDLGYQELYRKYCILREDPLILSPYPPKIDGPDVLTEAPNDVVVCWWRKP